MVHRGRIAKGGATGRPRQRRRRTTWPSTVVRALEKGRRVAARSWRTSGSRRRGRNGEGRGPEIQREARAGQKKSGGSSGGQPGRSQTGRVDKSGQGKRGGRAEEHRSECYRETFGNRSRQREEAAGEKHRRPPEFRKHVLHEQRSPSHVADARVRCRADSWACYGRKARDVPRRRLGRSLPVLRPPARHASARVRKRHEG